MLNRIALAFASLLLVASCNEGHDDLLQPRDLAVSTDSGMSDMITGPSMDGPMGKTCGDVFKCLLGSGLGGGGTGGGTGGLGNVGMCVMGVDPAGAQQAIALGICAATNCLAGLGGGPDAGAAIDPTKLFVCLLGKCAAQLSACDGLSLGLGGGP
jgi:hypothetical protein